MTDTENLFETLNAASDAATQRDAQKDAALESEKRENARTEKARKRAMFQLVTQVGTAAALLAATRYCVTIGQMGQELASMLATVTLVHAGAWFGGWVQFRFGKGGAMYGKV